MTAEIFYTYIDTPVGRIFVRGDGQFITGLFMPRHKRWVVPEAAWQQSEAPFEKLREQLGEYFLGKREEFDLPLKLSGTAFQERVWQELTRIPYGTTISYSELAERIGKPSAMRAVGNANGRNPISIIVPCHRVIGANGTLTGYASGVENKQWLLGFESSTRKTAPESFSDTATVSFV